MGFLTPKPPKPPPPPNEPVVAEAPSPTDTGIAPAAASLISTSSQGLRRRATTQRSSLIGGG